MGSNLKFDQKIRTRLFKQFLLAFAFVLVIIGFLLHYISFAVVRNVVYQRAEIKLSLGYELISNWIDEDSIAIKTFANYLSFQKLPGSKVRELIKFEQKHFAISPPYVSYNTGEFISSIWTPNTDYNVKDRAWFQESQRFFADKTNWNSVYFSKPYVSANDERYVFTMSAPILGESGVIGFTSVDIDIGELEHMISRIDDVMGSWYVVSEEGYLLLFGNNSNLVGSNIHDLPDAQVYTEVLQEDAFRLDSINILNFKHDTYFSMRDRSTGWVIIYRVNDDIIHTQVSILNYGLLGASIVLLAVFALIISIVSKNFTEPIVLLAHEAERVAAGDFACNVQTSLRDELGYLAYQFNFMVMGLKEREEYEKHKARVDSELKAGQSIQSSMLPKDLLKSDYFSLYAFYASSREVGGDFYDYFKIRDELVVFCIGDVSGKGVPAALFMTMVCTLIRAICPVEPDPAAALKRLNRAIYEHNSESMFATVFLCYYNPLTGKCRYGNAGHNPAYIITAEGIKKTEDVTGMLVGGISGAKYSVGCFELEPGESVVLYTDGVTEAHSRSLELFSESRLEEILATAYARNVTELGVEIVQAVDKFQENEQFDDITLLIWKRT